MTNPRYVDTENEVLRNRLAVMKKNTRALVDAVERYVEPKPGQPYLHRTALLRIKNEVKSTL